MSTLHTNSPTPKKTLAKFKYPLQKILRQVVIVVCIGVVGNLAFTIYTAETGLFKTLLNFKLVFLILAFFCAIYRWFGQTFRLLLWSKYMKVPLNFKDALRVSVAVNLGAAITPTIIGGSPLKLGLLVRQGFNAGQATTLILLSSLEDIAYAVIAIIAALLFSSQTLFIKAYFKEQPFMWLVYIIGIAFTVYLCIYIIKKWSLLSPNRLREGSFKNKYSKLVEILKKTYTDTVHSIKMLGKAEWWRFVVSLCLVATEWTARFSVPLMLALALDLRPSAVVMFFKQLLVYVLMLFVPSPGATGGAESFFYLVYDDVLPKNLLPAIMTGWRFLNYYLLLLVAAAFLIIFGLPEPPEDTSIDLVTK